MKTVLDHQTVYISLLLSRVLGNILSVSALKGLNMETEIELKFFCHQIFQKFYVKRFLIKVLHTVVES